VADIGPNSRVPFGRKPDKGKPLCKCSDKFLAWIVESLWDTDMHVWAFVAKTIIDKRAADGKAVKKELSLDAQTDAFLRNRGYGDLARKH